MVHHELHLSELFSSTQGEPMYAQVWQDKAVHNKYLGMHPVDNYGVFPDPTYRLGTRILHDEVKVPMYCSAIEKCLPTPLNA